MFANKSSASIFVLLLFFNLFFPLSNRFEKDFQKAQKNFLYDVPQASFQIDHPHFCTAIISHYKTKKKGMKILTLNGIIKEQYQLLHFFWIEKNYIICEFQEIEKSSSKNYYIFYKGKYFFSDDVHFKNLKEINYDPLFFILNELKAEGVRWID